MVELEADTDGEESEVELVPHDDIVLVIGVPSDVY